jgi:hypothetical protein
MEDERCYCAGCDRLLCVTCTRCCPSCGHTYCTTCLNTHLEQAGPCRENYGQTHEVPPSTIDSIHGNHQSAMAPHGNERAHDCRDPLGTGPGTV